MTTPREALAAILTAWDDDAHWTDARVLMERARAVLTEPAPSHPPEPGGWTLMDPDDLGDGLAQCSRCGVVIFCQGADKDHREDHAPKTVLPVCYCTEHSGEHVHAPIPAMRRSDVDGLRGEAPEGEWIEREIGPVDLMGAVRIEHHSAPSPSSQQEPSEEDSRAMFHRLWTKAVGNQDYDKKEWQRLESAILAALKARRGDK